MRIRGLVGEEKGAKVRRSFKVGVEIPGKEFFSLFLGEGKRKG